MKNNNLERDRLTPFLEPIMNLWNSAWDGLKSGMNIISDEDFLEALNDNDHLLADIEERFFDQKNQHPFFAIKMHHQLA